MDDETPENENESDKVKVDNKSTKHTSGGMSLRRQPRKKYNCKNYNDNVFNVTNTNTQDLGMCE